MNNSVLNNLEKCIITYDNGKTIHKKHVTVISTTQYIFHNEYNAGNVLRGHYNILTQFSLSKLKFMALRA